MNEFKITFSSELIKSKYHQSPGILEDEVSRLTYAIFKLAKDYEQSQWNIVLGSQEYLFYFDEIPLIWNRLPEKLNQIVKMSLDTVWLTFVQQGNDKAIVVEKTQTDDLLVSIIGTQYNSLYRKYIY